MKLCKKCEVEKDESDFYNPQSFQCKDCQNKYRHQNYERNKEKELAKNKEYRDKNRAEINAKARVSSKLIPKETRKAYSDRYYQKHLTEIRERSRERYEQNKDSISRKHFAAHIKRKYKLEIEEYDKMLGAQGNACKICSVVFGKKSIERPCVDHCHKTGKVRALLCRKCNLSLSVLEDYSHIEQAFQYLKSMK